MGLLVLVPIVWVVISSFKSDTTIFSTLMPFSLKAFSLDNLELSAYRNILVSRNFGRAVFNSLYIAIWTVVLGLLFNSLCAFGFSVFNFRGRKFLFMMVLLTFMIPFGSIALPLYMIVSKLGILNSYAALILPAIANGLGVFLFRQFFLDIPISYLDAARIDGAGWFRIYFSIYLRLSVPIVISAGIILFLSQWEAFMWPLIAGREIAIRVIQVAIADYNQETEIFWNQIFAACTISILIPVAIVLPLQKYYILGITGSGLKE
jgi:multiple sugar transport system permease protein/putative chitobiose transport system permease protein